MAGRVLIVGQGLAGTALGLELEAAGRPFAIASEGQAQAASLVAAGLVNPVAGQRFVKVWGVDELLPFAAQWYRAVGARLGVTLWHPLQLHRKFANPVEAGRAARKLASGELGPLASAADDGLAIQGAAWVDLPALLGAARERWRASGCLREREVRAEDLQASEGGVSWRGEAFDAAVLCTGHGALARVFFPELPLERAKGEILRVRGARLAPGRAVSRGTWVLAEAEGRARIGATYERGVEDILPTEAARERLLEEARQLVAGDLVVSDQRAGVRVSLPDRLPAVGWASAAARVGFLGALGSKGTLFAPWLARGWRERLDGAASDWPVALSVTRYRSGAVR